MDLVSRSAIIATLLIQSSAASQVHDLQFEHLTVEQGLSSNSVWGIFNDSKGFMWFGTNDGLNKFDGYSFTVYRHDPLDTNAIPINNIPELFEDRSGTLWLLGPGGSGSCRFDRATGKFTSGNWLGLWQPLADTRSSFHEDTAGAIWFAACGRGLIKFDRTSGAFVHYTLSSDTVYGMCADPDEGTRILWVGTARGLDRLDRANGTFTHFEHGSRNRINTIHGDRSGMLWLGTDEGLYKFNKATGTFLHYPVNKRVSGSSERNNVLLIYEDKRDMLWIGTGDGLFRFEQATGTFKEYRSNKSPLRITPSEQPWSIIEDSRGELWVGTAGGVGRYDRAKDKFILYVHDPKNPQSLSDNVVLGIYEDKSGTLWFGTEWGGLNKLDRARKAFSHYTQNPADPQSLSDKTVFGLCEDRSGALWIATMGGLNKFDRQTETFTHHKHDPHNPHSIAGNVVRSVLEDSRGTIWVGTYGRGLDRLDPVKSDETGRTKERFVHFTHDPRNPNSLSSNSILSLFEDKSGRLWIGTPDAGLDQYDRESGIFVHYKHDDKDPGSLSWNWVNAIYEDKAGTLWVGTGGDSPLHKLERATGKFTRYYWDQKNPKSLSSYSVHSIYEDSRGTLWIGTSAGLNRFERSTETFTHFTVRDGVASDFIGAILEDDSGCLWLKTGKGVSRFNPNTGKFRNYDAGDGVNINPTWGKASYKNKNGEMFFGGTNGFVRFYPDSIKDNSFVPPIVITAFKKFDKPVLLDTLISEKKVLRLSYEDNAISFEFVALNYTSPEKNQYAYKLEGFDRDWVYCGTRRYASYTNLDGGTYVFRVKGTNNDGIWNDAETSIAVIITPPFWKTWWFRTIFLVALALSIGGTVRYIGTRKLRLKLRGLEQEHALERERLRISRDMHDEVGANLTEIAILSELVKRDILKPEEAVTNVQKISERARKLIDNISEIIWAINPRNDKLDNLTGYIREFASEYFEITPITCRFNFPEQMFSHPLSAEVRRNIFLTIKEAINNVVKHSGATSVELDCFVSDHIVGFSIQDDGKGFAIEDVSLRGNGLHNMRKRVEDINGNFQIESQPGCGTRIRLTVPLT